MCRVWIINIGRIKINTHSTLKLQRRSVRAECVSKCQYVMVLSTLLVSVVTNRTTVGARKTGG